MIGLIAILPQLFRSIKYSEENDGTAFRGVSALRRDLRDRLSTPGAEVSYAKCHVIVTSDPLTPMYSLPFKLAFISAS